MNEKMEYQLKNLLKNNQPQDYIEIIEEENEEYIEIINNLQSKIDKAIEYIEKSMNNPQPFYEYLYGDEDGKVENLDKLLDILKEDK